MRSVLLSNYEVISIFNSSNSTKNRTEETKKKLGNDSKDEDIRKFSILLDSQIKSIK